MKFRSIFLNKLSNLLTIKDEEPISDNEREATSSFRVKNASSSIASIVNRRYTTTTASATVSNTILNNIYEFWQDKKDIYQTYSSSPDATEDDYFLYGVTLMLWAFGHCSPIRDIADYPIYFAQDCRISNPQKLHIYLIKNGFLGLPNIYEIFQSYKLPDLKIIAESIGCSKGGRKADLIQRIIDNLSLEDKENCVEQSNSYSLTEKGESFLQNNYDLVELHKNSKYNVSLSEFIANRIIGGRKRSFNDNIYTILAKRIYNNTLKRAYYFLESDYRSSYEITLSEGRYDIAIKDYITSLYLRTCCVRIASYTHYTEHDYSYEIVFTATTATKMIELTEFYHQDLVDNVYNDISLPPSFLTKEEFLSAISEMLSETMFDFEKYNNIIRERLNKYSSLEN